MIHPDASQLPKQVSVSRFRSVLLAFLFSGICAGFGFIVGITNLILWDLLSIEDGAFLTRAQASVLVVKLPVLFAIAYAPVLLFTWLRGGSIVLRRAGARVASTLEERRVGDVAEEVAIAAGVPAPGVLIIDDNAPNALVAGSDPRHATIAVTTGLVGLLNREQIQAVVAHEIAHVINGDIRFNTFLCANSSRFGAFADWIDRFGSQWYNPLILLWPGAVICRWMSRLSGLAASRQRTFLADATAVTLTRDPLALIGALRALASAVVESRAHDDLVNLYVVDPGNPSSERSTWAHAHPSLRERIRRLEELVS